MTPPPLDLHDGNNFGHFPRPYCKAFCCILSSLKCYIMTLIFQVIWWWVCNPNMVDIKIGCQWQSIYHTHESLSYPTSFLCNQVFQCNVMKSGPGTCNGKTININWKLCCYHVTDMHHHCYFCLYGLSKGLSLACYLPDQRHLVDGWISCGHCSISSLMTFVYQGCLRFSTFSC